MQPKIIDIEPDGQRLGFEDIASLMGLRVRDTLSDRKYHGSYERVADVLKLLRLPEADLQRFFKQVAFTVMVRNGDGHLKNYGVLYRSAQDIWFAPMFDVVTTSVYRYQRYDGGPELEDSTLALKLFAGKGQTRGYPSTAELLRFGRAVCRVAQPGLVLQRIGEAMRQTLDDAVGDTRVPAKAWTPCMSRAGPGTAAPGGARTTRTGASRHRRDDGRATATPVGS